MTMDIFRELLLRVKDVFLNFDFKSDILDIILVTLMIFAVILQLRKTQSIHILKGLLLIGVIYVAAMVFDMKTSSFIFSRLFADIMLILIILFSPEIRKALENMGKKKIGTKFGLFGNSKEDIQEDAINAVCRACGAMGRNKVGSLILFQRESLLGNLTKQAVSIDSFTSFEMLCSIFWPKTPLHDGAVVIQDGRIVAARCVVPMRNDIEVPEGVGTRHRAAIAATTDSDCIAVVTSEETGNISIAVDGKLKRGISDAELRVELGKLLLENEKPKKKIFAIGKRQSLPPQAVPEGEVSAEIKINKKEGNQDGSDKK